MTRVIEYALKGKRKPLSKLVFSMEHRIDVGQEADEEHLVI
jgi:hypothetical protein